MQQFQKNDQDWIWSYSWVEKEDWINQETYEKVCFQLLLENWEWNAIAIVNKANTEK